MERAKMDGSTTLTHDHIEVFQTSPTNITVCYGIYRTHTNGLWQVENPLNTSLPSLIMQLTLYVALTRLLIVVFKSYHQPRIVAELVGGLLLGPTVFGETDLMRIIFTFRTNVTLETIGNLGLIYYLFLVGLETDLTPIMRPGKKSLSIAAAGILLPASAGVGLYFLLLRNVTGYDSRGCIYWAISLTITSFPDIAGILADLKLLHTEVARTAVSAGAVSDTFGWFLFVVSITLLNESPAYVFLSTLAYIMFSIYILRPAISRLLRLTLSPEKYNEGQVCFLLAGVLVSALITDACGIHTVLGALVFGVIIRNEDIATTIVEKINFFVSGIMLPVFYLVTGLRIQVRHIMFNTDLFSLVVVLVMAFAAKIASTFFVCFFYKLPPRIGLAIGVLMNTKGVLALVIINIGRDQRSLDNQTFAAMALSFLLMTIAVSPIINFIYKPKRLSKKNKQRTIQKTKPDAELRLLACIHSKRNVSSIINLLKASNPTKRSPICIFAVHLLELVGRSTAMIIVHETCRIGTRNTVKREKAQSEYIFNALENYEKESFAVSVQPLTVVSPYSSMDEDICNLAEDKRVTLIISPFHKKPRADGDLEDDNAAIQEVNRNLLINSPCSVCIFVDRGLSATITATECNLAARRFAILFIGGPDDREALAYAWRMAGFGGVSLTVIRFVPDEDAADLHEIPTEFSEHSGHGILTALTDSEKEKQLDEEYISEFRYRTGAGSEESMAGNIDYLETVANNGAETLAKLREMEHDFELYIIGRGQGMVSPLTAGLTEWKEEMSELGAMGDTLLSSTFAAHVSLLVVQQYVADKVLGDQFV